MKNSKFNTYDVKVCCENKLNIKFREGREYNGWFWLGDIKFVRITIPKGRKYIPPKTYRSMARQLKLSDEQFDSLLECPLDKTKYETILRLK